MKKCPKCETAYSDETLDFCLDDGTRLLEFKPQAAVKTEVFSSDQASAETLFFDKSAGLPKTVGSRRGETVSELPASTNQTASLKQRTIEKGYRALEIGAVFFALAHNWWQWLYIDRQSYSGNISRFFFSAEFLVWILLFMGGAAAGIAALKFSRRKDLGYISLIMLAINLILILVPRR